MTEPVRYALTLATGIAAWFGFLAGVFSLARWWRGRKRVTVTITGRLVGSPDTVARKLAMTLREVQGVRPNSDEGPGGRRDVLSG